jgi:hypothetical protein
MRTLYGRPLTICARLQEWRISRHRLTILSCRELFQSPNSPARMPKTRSDCCIISAARRSTDEVSLHSKSIRNLSLLTSYVAVEFKLQTVTVLFHPNVPFASFTTKVVRHVLVRLASNFHEPPIHLHLIHKPQPSPFQQRVCKQRC